MQLEWAEMVAREGATGSPGQQRVLGEDDEPPCPACGTAAPLVDGACSDCGLHLA